MRRAILGVLCAALAFDAVRPVVSAEVAVDLELVLAVDVSDSMDHEEQVLQRRGYAKALSGPDLAAAIAAGPRGRIAVIYVEWAGPNNQHVVVPWTLIDSAAAARAFAARLAGPVTLGLDGTSLSAALAFCARLFDANGFSGDRRAIDVSGDGVNNRGAPVTPARDRVARRGITINGLPIIVRKGWYDLADLEDYYRGCVIGGDGSFLIAARTLGAFEDAIRRKLHQEVSATAPRAIPAAARAAEGAADCLIGEKMGGGLYPK